MTFLLDVNVLIALMDPVHIAHDAAHRWFDEAGRHEWATCPLTENGVIRIVGHVRYPNSPGSPAEAAKLVARLREHPGHRFWPDDISLVEADRVDAGMLSASHQVTDSYLLALAVAHGGQLATFDRKLSARAVRGGQAALHLIG